jgi:ABC-type nitrate/sulfonate/bicarbonate transport system permease component
MQNILDNPYVIGTLTMFIFLYAATIRPELPPYIKVLFTNPIFKILVLFLIVVRGNKDPLFSLAIATAFVTTISYLNQQQAKEAFTSLNNEVDNMYKEAVGATDNTVEDTDNN